MQPLCLTVWSLSLSVSVSLSLTHTHINTHTHTHTQVLANKRGGALFLATLSISMPLMYS